MSIPGAVLRDMEESFPFGRKPSRLRERSKLVRHNELKRLLSELARGIRTISIPAEITELAYSDDPVDKALLMIALYYPVTLASKDPADPGNASTIVNARILLQEAGLERAARNVGEVLRSLGRSLVYAISEIADPEYALKAARAALSIGKATGDSFLEAFGAGLLSRLGEDVGEYPEDPEAKLAVSAALLTLGRFREASEVAAGLDDPRGIFVKALAALLSDDKIARGEAIEALRSSDSPEAAAMAEILEALRCARLGKEKCFDEAISRAKELLSEAPELASLVEFVENLKAEL